MSTVEERLASYVFLLSCGSEQGSAFMVSPTLALTSRHCVVDHFEDQQVPIVLIDPLGQVHRRCRVAPVAIPVEDDAVLLELEEPIDGDRVLPLIASHVPSALRWISFAYPRVRGRLGATLAGMTGRSINPDLASWDFELTCEPGSDLSTYEGASGAPVIVAGAVRGMLQRSIAGALGALSLRRLRSILKNSGVKFPGEHHTSRLPKRLGTELEGAVPNSKTAGALETAIKQCNEGYVLVVGSPGSGKSVLVAGFVPVTPAIQTGCAEKPHLSQPTPSQRLATLR